MPTFMLLAEWSEWGNPVVQKEQREPFFAASAEEALTHLQYQQPFLKGLPWHFAGKNYKLLSEVEVGEKFVMSTTQYD